MYSWVRTRQGVTSGEAGTATQSPPQDEKRDGTGTGPGRGLGGTNLELEGHPGGIRWVRGQGVGWYTSMNGKLSPTVNSDGKGARRWGAGSVGWGGAGRGEDVRAARADCGGRVVAAWRRGVCWCHLGAARGLGPSTTRPHLIGPPS
ncbi:hypothetical protein Pcinc_001818 [Petrolisthes cinctipes]|uniref:Uncharacterized protein n=1 Tax=Petrolisthes cinctipes TaxID=88211 RepID=A0AAE1GM42_PETCI|nr:hypothetical protein Pcinc_001818 [Petrolisthes cinctipes]